MLDTALTATEVAASKLYLHPSPPPHPSHPSPPPQTPRQPIALDRSSAEDSQARPNGFHEAPIMLDTALTATEVAASKLNQTGASATTPAVPHTILNFWLDAAQEDLASARPGSNPSIAMALPSILIPDLLHCISRLANSTRSNTLTLNASSVGISPRRPASNKRKLSIDADNSQVAQGVRVEISQNPKRQKRKGAFSRMPLLDLETLHNSPIAVTPADSHGPATTITRESLYSKDGSLELGLVAASRVISTPRSEPILAEPTVPEPIIAEPTEAEEEQRDSDERMQLPEGAPMIAQTPTQNPPVVETPRSGRWGFGDLFKSARSVSKFLPGFQRAASVPTPIIEDNATDPNPHLAPTPPAVDRSVTNVDTVSQSSAAPAVQLESPQPIEPRGNPEIEDTRRRIINRQKKSSKTGIQASRKRADRDRNMGVSNLKAPESFAQSTKNTTPGSKRKRMPSPDTIPNPKGTSYGMDLDYFRYVSSEEEDEVITPSKHRPSKLPRLHGPERQEAVVQVDTGKAQPYRSGSFSSGTMNYKGENVFNKAAALESSKLQSRKSISEKPVMGTQQSVSVRTPITNLTGSFRVPSPSDSDSDPEDPRARSPSEHTPTPLTQKGQDVLHPTGASPKKPSQRAEETSLKTDSFTNKGKASRTQSPPSKAITSSPKKAPTTWTQPPPPRPNPSHAALPAVSSADSEALARARKKALHYQPHKPSGLRASSRISSPRVLEDSNVAVMGSNSTLMNQTGNSSDIDTALAARSNNAFASKVGQPNTSTDSERVESSFEKEVPDMAAKENSTSLTVVESAPPIYVRDSKIEACVDAFWRDEHTKEASDVFEALYAAFLAKQ